MRRAAAIIVTALASSAAHAEPWAGPMDATGLDGFARCGSLYALLAANDARPEARAAFEAEMVAHFTLLDAGDRLQRGEPVLPGPQLSQAWIAAVTDGIERYRATVAESVERRGDEASRTYLAEESARCVALRASIFSVGKTAP